MTATWRPLARAAPLDRSADVRPGKAAPDRCTPDSSPGSSPRARGSPRTRRVERSIWCLALIAGLWGTSALALRELELGIGGIQGPGWSGGGITLTMRRLENGLVSARLRAAGLALPGPAAALRELQLHCPGGRLEAGGLACPGAELRMIDAGGVEHVLPAPLSIRREGAAWHLALDRVPWQSSRIAITASPGAEGWRIAARFGGLEPRRIWDLLGRHWPLPAITVGDGGQLAVDFVVAGEGGARRVEIAVEGAALGFSDASGLHAGEDLEVRLRAALRERGEGWSGRVELALEAGGLYLDPIFLDLGAAPINVVAEGRHRAADGILEVTALDLVHAGVARLHGTLQAGLKDAPALTEVALELEPAPAGPLYRTYLQPFLFGGALGALGASGEVGAHMSWRRAAGARLHAQLHRVAIEDDMGRFGIRDIDGELAWDEGGAGEPVSMSWSGGSLYRLDFEAGQIRGVTAGRDFYLEQPVSVPTLGGAVVIQALDVRGLGTGELTWEVRGGVDELSMERLTGALGWPAFGGTISGRTPRVRYADREVTVDGELTVGIFDGDVKIRDLSVRDPLGLAPVLRADVDVGNLSLHALTGTFSFGNIQGRLAGYVHDLVLQDWRPVAFDARLATPTDDDSRHRISQRAVRNLTRLGGAGAVLSSTVLGLFNEFSYRRLGIACRLRDGVCEMDGVAGADGGYVIVEGGGFPPRIDVRGFNRRVDWDVLVSRLKNVIGAPPPVIR